MPSPTKRRGRWFAPLALLGLAAALTFGGTFLIDWWRFVPTSGVPKPDPFAQFFHFDPDATENALGNLAQVITAILGIVITVVSIVVQLAATRYTPRIADMFFRDRTNLLLLGFFVVAGIHSVWVSVAVTHEFVPRVTIAASLLLVTSSVLLMVPYFGYVFDFLDPERIVARIEQQALQAARSPRSSGSSMGAAQVKVLRAIEQLSDVAMNAIAQRDKLIAQGAIDALKELAVAYLAGKSSTPRDWFAVGASLRQNPDFVSLAPESIEDLAARGVWVEWKVLRQYQAVYNEALSQMPDMNYLVAIDTRYIGDAALASRDPHVLDVVVKFFNTYLRSSLNAQQIRTAYNVLNQYRQLGEHVLASADALPRAPGRKALVVEIASYFRYYGQLAQKAGLGFIAETVAYDLATLCERAYEQGSPAHDDLLRVLLTVDQKAETGEQELVLRGVRKAQVKLATFYLCKGALNHARAIAADMREEPGARLRLIREELEAVTSGDFWEVVDRGTNFEFLDDARRAQLAAYFELLPAHSAMISGRHAPIDARTRE